MNDKMNNEDLEGTYMKTIYIDLIGNRRLDNDIIRFKDFSQLVEWLKYDKKIEKSCFILVKNVIDNGMNIDIKQVNYRSSYNDDLQWRDQWNLDNYKFMVDGWDLYISHRYTEYEQEEIEITGRCTDEFFWHCQGTVKNGQCLNCGHWSENQESYPKGD